MSLSPTIVNYRQILGQLYFSPIQRTFIQNMPELIGIEWQGNHLPRPPWIHGSGKKIKKLTNHIFSELEQLQGNYCIYCGMSFEVTSGKQVEHIAPKGEGRYPQFMFEGLNLVLSCALCNGFEKKERKEFWNTIEGAVAANYEDCEFTIVHPYFHDPKDHFEFLYNYDHDGEVIIRGISPKGICSISTFKLDEEPLTTERAKHVDRWAKRQNCDIENLILETLIRTGNF